MLIADGFLGQRLRVLPQPLITAALSGSPTKLLLVTDAGHFPHAAAHGRRRPHGAAQAVVILCVDGRGLARIRDQDYPIAAGDALVIPPGVPHSYRAHETDPWTIWWLHAAGTDVGCLLESIAGADGRRVVQVRDMYAAIGLVEHAVSCLELDETMPSLLGAAGAAWNLLAQLAADRQLGRPESGDRIRLAQDSLRQHLATPTSVPELAKYAGMSASHFSALFKASTGIGVVEYVKRLRSARARELLITTHHTIAEIARAVGYADAFYFSRQFRAVNGVSPSEYRLKSHLEAV